MKVLVELKLVRLDDGALKATIVHEGEPQVFYQQFETVDDACRDLAKIFVMLPTQSWFRILCE